jgi:hypothetical protein
MSVLFVSAVYAYEIDTHERLSIEAYEVSVLRKDPELLPSLGINDSDKFKNSENTDRTIRELVGDGARLEDGTTDCDSRPRNHFYDPLSGRGLHRSLFAGEPSPDWALEDATDFSAQEFSYRHANDYLYKALTLPTRNEREKYFGKTFQTLGQVIHHLQDMAQPQHVRNDIHINFGECWLKRIFGVLENPSLYEQYTKTRGSDLPLADDNYNPNKPIVFNTAVTSTSRRTFWTDGINGDGRGIADFTNRNFVSAGTNFTGTATNISPNVNYPSPSGISAVVSSRQITDADLLGPNQPLSGEIDFIGTPVTDTYRPAASGFNDRTSSYSLFDADLTAIGSKKTFTLNRFNFEAAYPFLMPKAVGYSAGLIDYFFRGKIDIISDPLYPGSQIIKNLASEPMYGTFTLYYDAVDGNRYPVPGSAPDRTWEYVFISGADENGPGQSVPLTFTPPSDPPPQKPGEYMLVFRGWIGGSEAVAAKLAPHVGGIEFDAVFDLKNITTFRFVVKVKNNNDFAFGVIIQAADRQAWVSLQPGETKHLAGAVSVSGMSNWSTYLPYLLHPASTSYGWDKSWGAGYEISMYNGVLSIPFRLFLTDLIQPETTPANLPARKATKRWYWDPTLLTPSLAAAGWAAIKRYSPDGRYYDYEFNLPYYGQSMGALTSIPRTTTKPAYQPLINPATYFVTGYDTGDVDVESPWHKRPWPTSRAPTVPIMCSGEGRMWDGSQYVWVPINEVSLSLTRSMLQQVAAALGITEYVVMDGDDIRWFQPMTNDFINYWEYDQWIDRFYTRGGSPIDSTAMRAAFQAVIDSNAASWPYYRNLVVHPSVRFGSFLNNGSLEVGHYLLGPNGDMVEVSSLDDLKSVSTKFLYYIDPSSQ